MARLTIEDCLKVIDNAFDICSLAGRRAKDLASGAEPLIDCNDKPTVIALREIAAEKIGMDYFEISNKEKIESQLFKKFPQGKKGKNINKTNKFISIKAFLLFKFLILCDFKTLQINK